jgi:arylsulfatase A-like enzyme
MKHVLLVALWLLTPPAALYAAGAPSSKPNILFLIADDLATRLGCYSDKAAITPHLDRSAREGVLFHRAYAPGFVCIPSRTSFTQGLNNQHAGAEHFNRHPDTMTLGRWFREHRYQTFSAGKVDHDETYTDPRAWDIRWVAMRQQRPRLPLNRSAWVGRKTTLFCAKTRYPHISVSPQ